MELRFKEKNNKADSFVLSTCLNLIHKFNFHWWGKKGDAEGEFNIPHGLDLDDKGNVYVADRENSRIQVFDSSGRFLKTFSNKNFGNICSLTFDKTNKKLVAIDDVTFLKIKHRGSDILILDSAGNTQTRFGRSGFYDGAPYAGITM